MKKFLIIRTGALGDLIQTYPVIHYLHEKFPDAQIDWMVEPSNASLVQAHPYIHKTLLVPTKFWRKKPFEWATWKTTLNLWKEVRQTTYDAIFDLQGNSRSGIILSQLRSPNKVGFAWNSVSEWPNLLFTNKKSNPPPGKSSREDYLAIVANFFGESPPPVNDQIVLKITPEQQKSLDALNKQILSKSKDNIIVCPGSAWPNKQLSTESLIAFLSLIQQSTPCNFLFVWGSANERTMTEQLHAKFPDGSHIIDRMSLPVLQHFMGMCDLVIAMDSMALHLAATTQTPTFSVFGASSSNKYKPLGDQHKSFQGQCPYGYTFAKRCPILRTCKTGACIHDITAQQLFDRLKDKGP